MFDDSMTNIMMPIPVLESFDAILFVDKTTAARPNPRGRAVDWRSLPGPQNLAFEDGLKGWKTYCAPNFGYRTGVEQGSGYIAREPGDWPGEMQGDLRQKIDAKPFLGKTITLKAKVRAEVSDPASGAQLWIEAVDSGLGLPLCRKDAAVPRDLLRNSTWQEYTLECSVPASARAIQYGMNFNGYGKVYLDKVTLQLR